MSSLMGYVVLSGKMQIERQETTFLTCVIPTNLYGPNDNFSDGCHFIPGIIKRVTQAKQGNAEVMVVPGSGRALRQFLYSRDLARVLIWTMREYDEAEPFIVSVDPEEEISIKDAVMMVSESSGFKGAVQWDTSATDGQLRKTADNARMRRLLGDFQFTTLEQGMSFFLHKRVHLLTKSQTYRVKRNFSLAQCEPGKHPWCRRSKRPPTKRATINSYPTIYNYNLLSIQNLVGFSRINAISASTISFTNPSNETSGFQSRFVAAFCAEPRRYDTSAGRCRSGSIRTRTCPVRASRPISSVPLPLQLY